LIARREFTTRIRSRFFIFGTLIFAVLLAGYIVLQAVVISRVTTTVKIGFAGDAQALAQPLKTLAATVKVTVQIHQVADAQDGDAQVKGWNADAAVTGDAAAPTWRVQDNLDPTVEATLNALVNRLRSTRALVASGADPTGHRCRSRRRASPPARSQCRAAHESRWWASSSSRSVYVSMLLRALVACWRRRKSPTGSSRSCFPRCAHVSCCSGKVLASGSSGSCS
jgi:hypothetical protein